MIARSSPLFFNPHRAAPAKKPRGAAIEYESEALPEFPLFRFPFFPISANCTHKKHKREHNKDILCFL
jgi:hypothetical protein